jgi:hypothetical protein
MSNAVLEKDKNNPGGGTVLLSKGSDWIRPTGVFLPDSALNGNQTALTVLLWFHGHFIEDVPALFYKEDTKILQAVVDSGKPVVLVAPWLGWWQDESHTSYSAGALGGGKKTEQYLDQVLTALADWYPTRLIDIDLDKKPPLKFQVGELYVGGHSGGGSAIMSAVASLGRFRESLRECWRFDCLYGSGESWAVWARSMGGMPLYFYFGRGTQPAFKGDVLGFWKRVYGTPKSPLPLGRRMLNLYLAPALPGTALDMVAFRFSDDIKAKPAPGNRYEEVRRLVDPLLDNPATYWPTIIKAGLKSHYEVVSDLLGPRIRQSIY